MKKKRQRWVDIRSRVTIYILHKRLCGPQQQQQQQQPTFDCGIILARKALFLSLRSWLSSTQKPMHMKCLRVNEESVVFVKEVGDKLN